MSKSLPTQPSLRQLKLQAKDILKALASHQAGALDRFRQATNRSLKHDFQLSDAQLIVAREYGFASWSELRNGVKRDPIYNKIGIGYASQRKPDPRIFGQIKNALSSCDTVVNVGAGPGSYEPPTCTLAVEPAQRMIDQRPAGIAKCIRAFAEDIPLEDKSFDGSLACLTIHHWKDLKAGLSEMRRITRKRIVLFTWDPEFNANFWLPRDYIPEILQLDRPRFPTLRQLREMLGRIEVQTIPIAADCQDGFIGAFWKRPEAFFHPEVQQANSAMSQLALHVVKDGLNRLRDDLNTGMWHQRNANLELLTELDLGYRLIVSDQE